MFLSNIFRNTSRLGQTGKYLTALQNGSSSRWMSSLTDQFEAAKDRLGKLSEDPGNEAKLKIYSLFKQSTVGQVTTKRPGMMDFVGRAKWDAWNTLGTMTNDEAKQGYINFINELAGEEEAAAVPGEKSKFSTLVVTSDGGVTTIRLNRPKKKNAITWEMYNEWIQALEEASQDKKTVIVAVTGTGDYFCSGNDLSNFMNIPPEGIEKMADDGKDILTRFVSAFIKFPKPLIGVINGPAVGVSVTTLAMYDVVYCTDKATFHTPFTQLGQSAEGCSSYTFPKLMGTGLATEMLLFNKKLTAQEAKQAGLISEVFPDASFQQEVWPKIQEYSKLPAKCLVYSKALYRDREMDTLIDVMNTENDRLRERWVSDDCMNAVMSFMNKK